MLPLGVAGCCTSFILPLPVTTWLSDPEYEDNLKYFVEKGVRPDDGCDYLVVVQEVGAGVLSCSAVLSGCVLCGWVLRLPPGLLRGKQLQDHVLSHSLWLLLQLLWQRCQDCAALVCTCWPAGQGGAGEPPAGDAGQRAHGAPRQ